MDVNSMITTIFQDFTVIAGKKGLDREVKTVNVIDAPGIHHYLKGGEFLITTGYLLKEDPSKIKDLIISIHSYGAAALGIKLKRFIDELPSEVIETAEKVNLPIISIPIHYSFSDIINPVLSEIINKQARSLLYSNNIHKSFTDLAIRGGGVDEIIDTLANLIGTDIIYHDIFFEKVYKSTNAYEFLEKTKGISLYQITKEFKSYPIKIDSKTYGYIVLNSLCDHNNEDENEQIALEHASTVLKLEIQKKISNRQIEERHRDEFIQDLILNNIQSYDEINNRANLYNWNMDIETTVVIVDIDHFKEKYSKLTNLENQKRLDELQEKIFTLAKTKIKQSFSNVFYTHFSDSITFLIQHSVDDIYKLKQDIIKVSKQIRDQVSSTLNSSVMIGIGNYKKNPSDIHMSYREARNAIRLGRIIHKNNETVFHDQLGIFNLLETVDKEEARSFRDTYLGKLLTYDKVDDSTLFDSLLVLVENDWNLKLAAEQMFVHYNTMKYRFQKICDVLQMDLKKFENKINVTIAIRLYQMID
ncbi:PucR family transcriptional regulator [Bacillus timonensis]|uniref:PucR family transcriptional regulator n=1 Tax=Bacillus timonensis TaxID=1033734 RepID=UPI0002887CC4|nr:PucR family transcriptional regulator [Bacillus timonensis]